MRAAFVLLVLAGCPSPPAAPVPRLTCERAIPGLDARLVRGALLWFGEMHGTAQSPRFVLDVACHAAHVTRVQIGLEVPGAEQPRIDTFLASDGTPAARAALLGGRFWNGNDGRTSQAMFQLLDGVRRLRASGARIAVLAFDGPAVDRDDAMAGVVAAARDPEAIFVGLSGNIHSRRITGTAWDAKYVPLVAHLVLRGLAVTTFDVSADAGAYWGCASTSADAPPVCGEHANGQSEPGTPWTLGPARDPSHDGVYRVGPTTASPPARSTRT